MQKDFLNVKDAADFLGVSEQTLHDYRSADKGPKFFKPAGRVYYFKDDLVEWIRNGKTNMGE